jgi:hypothetical protein
MTVSPEMCRSVRVVPPSDRLQPMNQPAAHKRPTIIVVCYRGRKIMRKGFLICWLIYSVATMGNAVGGEIRSGADKCLDVDSSCQSQDGCKVQVWQCSESLNQRWTRNGVELKNGAGKCLDVDSSCQSEKGCKVQVYGCTGSSQQQWTLNGNQLKSGAGLCLDVDSGCQDTNGCKVQVWPCTNSRQQQWSERGASQKCQDIYTKCIDNCISKPSTSVADAFRHKNCKLACSLTPVCK